jgi:hypothetical protein
LVPLIVPVRGKRHRLKTGEDDDKNIGDEDDGDVESLAREDPPSRRISWDLEPEFEPIPSLESLGVALPPLDLFILQKQREMVEKREIQDLMIKKAKKKELEEGGKKVPKYLRDLPPTPPKASVL